MATHPLERQWLILRTLTVRRHGATVKELATEHATSLRTIRRDLEFLKKLGFPVYEVPGPFGRNSWFCDPERKFVQLGFNFTEILCSYLARRLLQPLAGSYLWEGTCSAFQKIRSTLSEDQLSYLENLSRVLHPVHLRTSDYTGKDRLIDDLVMAVEDRRMALITYKSARSTEPITYFIHPLGMVHYQQSLYLIAHSEHHEEIRHFKLDRVSEVVLQELQFQKPKEFDLQVYLQHAFRIFHEEGQPRQVVIRFEPDVRQYVEEHQWHASQKLEMDSSGRLLAKFELSSFSELKSWVLSFGSRAELLEPHCWREELRSELQQCFERYTEQEHHHA